MANRWGGDIAEQAPFHVPLIGGSPATCAATASTPQRFRGVAAAAAGALER